MEEVADYMAWLLHNWFGYLRIRLSGYSPERFFNLCSAGGIEIWNLKYQNGTCEFYMTLKGYRSCKAFVRKAKVRLRILKKLGLPFFLYRNRKRKLLFTGFFSFFLLLYVMSLFIWDISFDGNYRYTDEVLTRYFKEQDIRYGMFRKAISCDDIEAGIRNQFPEITWVSARVSGTRLLVKIKENEVLSGIPEKEDFPCDLVAARAGTITGMIVRQGVPQVKIGDTVEAGQLLVSSGVPITNDAEELVRTEYVHAEADIHAETKYQYTKRIPNLHPVKTKTGKTKKGYYLKLMDYNMTFLMPSKRDSLWQYVMEEQQLKIFENFYLPFYLGRINGEEYVTYERYYTEEEKNQLAEQVQTQYLENLMEKGVQIIENNVKILGDESVLTIEGDVTAQELIGQIKEITETEGEQIPDERSGDHD